MTDSAALPLVPAPVSPRALALLAFGLVALRGVLPAHTPAAVDAHLATAAIVVALLLPVPRAAITVGAAVLVAALASFPLSFDPWMSLLALPIVLGPLAFWCIGRAAHHALVRQALLAAVATAGALNAAGCFIQQFITWPDAVARAQELGVDAFTVHYLTHARPIGLSMSPDLCSALCVAGAGASVALGLGTRGRGRALAGVQVALSVGALMLTRSLGTAAALAVGLVTVGLVLRGRRLVSTRVAALVGAAFAAIVAGAAAAALLLRHGNQAVPTSIAERLENWHAALQVFLHAPFGVGLSRFGVAYLIERAPGSNVTRYAHAAWAQALAELGLVGCVALVVAGFFVVKAALPGVDRGDPARIALLGMAVALAARCVVDYDAQVAQTASIGALMIALALPDDKVAAPLWARRVAMSAAAACAVLALLLAWRERALQSDSAADTAAYAQTFTPDAEAQLAHASKLLEMVATCAAPEGCADAAVQARRVLDVLCARPHPPAAAHILRARLFVHEEELEAALADVDRALALDRGNPAAHQLGISLARAVATDDTARIAAAAAWGIQPQE